MAETDAATAEAAARAQSYRDSLEGLRSRTDTAAKGVAALGTAGLTAVGIEKVTDVFPYPDGGAWLVGVALAGFLGMVAVIVIFTVRLYRASEALNTSSEPEEMVVDLKERAKIAEIYKRMADFNDKRTLVEYEKEAHELQKAADALNNDDAKRKALYEKAARIRAEVRATQASAAHTVISARLRRALSDRKTKLLGLLFVAALLAFGLAVDRLDSERTAEATALKGCADAIEAKVPADSLPEFCRAAVSKAAEEEETPEQQAASQLANLAELYGTCVDTAVEDKQPLTTCDSIKDQLRTAAD